MLDRMLYRFAIIPATRRGLLRLRDADAWMLQRPDWGRGRIDPFNPVKYTILKQPVDTTIGHSDMVPLWNLKRTRVRVSLGRLEHEPAGGRLVVRAGRWGHDEVGRSRLPEMEQHPAGRDVQPAPGPELHQQRAAAAVPVRHQSGARGGRSHVYKAGCASCHAIGGARTGTVIPVAEVGTDRHRLDMWTPASATAYNAYGEGHAWKFSAFRTTGGYVSVPLEGLWLRAPYLHNGSVPSLVDLLEKTDRRPKLFRRGYDVYDPVARRVRVGGPGGRANRHGVRHGPARKRQRRASLRDGSLRQRQDRPHRISEDTLNDGPRTHRGAFLRAAGAPAPVHAGFSDSSRCLDCVRQDARAIASKCC